MDDRHFVGARSEMVAEIAHHVRETAAEIRGRAQAEIDQVRNDRHAAHDADRDGNLELEEFAGLWHETTRPFTVRVFQMLDTDGDAVITRAEFDRPLAGIVARLDRDGDGGLSLRDRRHHRHHEDRWDDD